jgi:hypothetical protein
LVCKNFIFQFIDDEALSGASFSSVVPAPEGGFYLYYAAHFGAGTPEETVGIAMAQGLADLEVFAKWGSPPNRGQGCAGDGPWCC